MFKELIRHAPLMLTLIVAGSGCRPVDQPVPKAHEDLAAGAQADFRELADRLETNTNRVHSNKGTSKALIEMVRHNLAHMPSQAPSWYYNAARILRSSEKLQDIILAHELAVVAVSQGEPNALRLAAQTEDEMLVAMGHPQRFGTVVVSNSTVGRHELAVCDQEVPDQLRHSLNVASIDTAKAKARALGPVATSKLPKLPAIQAKSPAIQVADAGRLPTVFVVELNAED